ncbi:phytanoyl-CoA dioxygenase family protein [Sorangium sp. So ce296]|uniref:phytanoyl-CoA dioxygenase family protein n=1 Tax=Sorangium sp. So ce296 TaxID=3133296 RepID=UPI003F61855F
MSDLRELDRREVMMNTSTRDRLDTFRARGFFVVPAFLDADGRAELRRACDAALLRTRALSQETGHSTPRISLLTDGMVCFQDDPRALELIAAFVGSPRVCELLSGLARPGEADTPRLKDAHYYHEPTRRDWDGDWHRDSQFGQVDPEVERAVVATTTSVHFRVAIEDDDRLEIVPGSHARWDTPDELRIRRGADRTTPDMPNAVRVALRAGDACVFHAWSIHRATYRREPPRRTLDALYAFGRATVRRWAPPGT